MPVKKIENRSVFHEYMDESLRRTFLGHPVVYMLLAMQMDAYNPSIYGRFHVFACAATRRDQILMFLYTLVL